MSETSGGYFLTLHNIVEQRRYFILNFTFIISKYSQQEEEEEEAQQQQQ